MNFYKILHESECHNGLQYETGLNVDPLPFAEGGSCVPGGIYFAREDILAFLSVGPWVREVMIPDGARMIKDPGDRVTDKWRADRVILGERRKLCGEVLGELVEEGANIEVNDGHPLRHCAELGMTEFVSALIELGADVHVACDGPLRWAAFQGELDVVKILVEAGADVEGSSALLRAVEGECIPVLEFLIDGRHNRRSEVLKWIKMCKSSDELREHFAGGK